MQRCLPTVFVICAAVGCGGEIDPVDSGGAITPATSGARNSSSEVDEFAERWKHATLEERQRMADLSKVGRLFLGATKEDVEAVFGPPDQSGIDNFGVDVIRYELGAMPDLDGRKVHLALEFNNGVVTRLTGNTISF